MELIVQDEAGRRISLPFVRPALTVGRNVDNDVRLPRRNVSRRHCRLVRDPAGLIVEDLGSSTGVRIGGQRVEGRALVPPGEAVVVGNFRLFVAEDPDELDEPVELESDEAIAVETPPIPKPSRHRGLLLGLTVAGLFAGGLAAFGVALWIGSGTGSTAAPIVDGAHGRSLLEKGDRLAEAGHLREAIRTLQAALAEDPALAEAHRKLAESWARLGDESRATEHYRRFLLLAPEAPEAEAIRRLLSAR